MEEDDRGEMLTALVSMFVFGVAIYLMWFFLHEDVPPCSRMMRGEIAYTLNCE